MPRIFGSRPPRPMNVVQNENHRKRARPPPADSMQTGLRSDGWYLGNDIHSVEEVWKLLQDIEGWIVNNPHRATSWHTKDHESKAERTSQERLRSRRRVLWDAIKHASVMASLPAEQIVTQLQELQNEMTLGITRIEAWAISAKKKGVSIIDEAHAYKPPEDASRTTV